MNERLQNRGLIAVVEFGATARGDADEHSDRDIFVLVEDAEPDAIARVRANLAAELDTSVSAVASYTVSTVDRMLALGSLFLWHLRLEGKMLYDPDGVAAEALGALRKYDSSERDVTRFRSVLSDVEAALEQGSALNAFECHVLFGVARNICMLLTVLAGNPRFGRRAVLPEARRLYPELPLSEEVFAYLESGHLLYHRGAAIAWSAVDGREADAVVAEVRELLEFARVKGEARS